MKIAMFLFVALAANLVEVQSIPDTEIEEAISHGGPQDPNRILSDTSQKLAKCNRDFGCQKGYCWAGCGLWSITSRNWCYTTKTYFQSLSYVTCTDDSECDPCWKCADSCWSMDGTYSIVTKFNS